VPGRNGLHRRLSDGCYTEIINADYFARYRKGMKSWLASLWPRADRPDLTEGHFVGDGIETLTEARDLARKKAAALRAAEHVGQVAPPTVQRFPVYP
jgi:hypothetical protein